MIRRHGTTLHITLMAADLLGAMALFGVVASVRFGETAWEALGRTDGEPWLAALLYGASWVIALWIRGLYRLRARLSLRRDALDILVAAAILALLTFAALFLLELGDVSRLFLLLLFPAQAGMTLASRAGLRWVRATLRAREGSGRFMLVVGAGIIAQELAQRVERHPALGISVIGHLQATDEAVAVTRPLLGTVDDLERVLHANVVDEVAVCLPPEHWALLRPIAELCREEGRVVRIPFAEAMPAIDHGVAEEFEGGPIVSVVPGPDRALALLVKRAVDLALAGALLVALSPLMAAIALRIRVADGRPVFFRQRRVGLHGRTFMLWKFRTMTLDAEVLLTQLFDRNEVSGRAFKLSDDPRLTRTGSLLRRISLDELPQLWNVLRGEMSLVGPRPPLPDEVAGYDLWHRRRLSMKPGMTGLWQVEARHDPVFDRWVRLDLDYIDRWSLWLDLVILLRTIPAVLGQSGR